MSDLLTKENLRKAIQLNPENKELAKTDADFDRIRDNAAFQALLQPSAD